MQIEQLDKEIIQGLNKLNSEADCADFFQKYLGKTGEITKQLQGLRDIEGSKRAEVGAAINTLRKKTEESFNKKQDEIKARELRNKLLSDELVDITIPDTTARRGGLHPITIITGEVEEIFKSMGFIVEDGPEIATEYENFEAVNVPENHPARDMQDTFWLSDGRVLRTHTSAHQNYMLKKYGSNFKAICPGRTYRNESVDATHDTTFFQVEGIMVGEDVSVANLVFFMKEALTAVFKKEVNIRLRPSFFPFTEPSFELDASCPFCKSGCPVCKHSGWIEFCGCGMIHPRVLEMGGVDPKKSQGFAFGFGLTRLAMMRWGLNDIRVFNSGNLEFLRGVK
jgi:phenylalanyl-tRNA synthetase alpha chain